MLLSPSLRDAPTEGEAASELDPSGTIVEGSLEKFNVA